MDKYFELFPNGIEIQPIYNGPITVCGSKLLPSGAEEIEYIANCTFPSELALIERIESYGYRLAEGVTPQNSPRFGDILASYHAAGHAILDDRGNSVGEIDIIRGDQDIFREFKTAMQNISTR